MCDQALLWSELPPNVVSVRNRLIRALAAPTALSPMAPVLGKTTGRAPELQEEICEEGWGPQEGMALGTAKGEFLLQST